MLRRSDAISYQGDMFGRVTGDNVRTHRATTIDQFKNFSMYGGNETIFKGPVTILDNIETIGAKSKAQRKRIIKKFKDHGITRMSDGRSVEDVVVTI
jgi:hypothetical protein